MARVQICDGRPFFFQWDTGAEIELCECATVTEVHFVTPGGTIRRDVVDNKCSVPDTALQTAGTLYVYAFARNESGGITRHEMRIGVVARPKPADYIDPPDEPEALALVAQRVAEMIAPQIGGVSPEQIKEAVQDYLAKNPPQGVSDEYIREVTAAMLEDAKASGEFDGEKGDKGDPGKDGADYILTEADKREIAGMVEVGGGGTVTDEHINSLIDAKLGVIENGTY